MADFHLNIAQYLRLHKGLRIKELSKLIGIGTNTLFAIEQNNFEVDTEAVQVLADYHGLAVEALAQNDFEAIIDKINCPPMPMGCIRAEGTDSALSGTRGERWIYEKEIKKLQGSKYRNAVNPNYSNEPSAGFDILSFSADGQPIYIEVKSTKGHPGKTFQLSAAELALARRCYDSGACYEIHRVYRSANRRSIGRYVISADDLFHNYSISPARYVIRRKE